jgi:hypothetical protein
LVRGSDGTFTLTAQKASGKQKVAGLAMPVNIRVDMLMGEHRATQDATWTKNPGERVFDYLVVDPNDALNIVLVSARPTDPTTIVALLVRLEKAFTLMVEKMAHLGELGPLASTTGQDGARRNDVRRFVLVRGGDGTPLGVGNTSF